MGWLTECPLEFAAEVRGRQASNSGEISDREIVGETSVGEVLRAGEMASWVGVRHRSMFARRD